MIVIAAALIGLGYGIWQARKRGGTRADMAQYGAGYAIALTVVAVFVTIAIERMV